MRNIGDFNVEQKAFLKRKVEKNVPKTKRENMESKKTWQVFKKKKNSLSLGALKPYEFTYKRKSSD